MKLNNGFNWIVTQKTKRKCFRIIVISIIIAVLIAITRRSNAAARSRSTMQGLPDILDFFTEVKGDLSKIIWGHAINNQLLLQEALKDDSPIMMLEADVSKGNLVNSPDVELPIMSHPPLTESDTSLEMWIQQVIEANKKGIKKGAKIDFKDLDIVMKSFETLRKHLKEIDFPLWVNADIVKGPGAEDSQPLDADVFLSLCLEFFPDATLSVGWKTKFVKNTPQHYTPEMFEEMSTILKRNHIRQPITFPIRASFVSNSLDTIKSFMKEFPEDTVTIWTSATDDVNLEGLAQLQHSLGQNVVYFDLPQEQIDTVNNLRKEIEKQQDFIDTSNIDRKELSVPDSSKSSSRTNENGSKGSSVNLIPNKALNFSSFLAVILLLI